MILSIISVVISFVVFIILVKSHIELNHEIQKQQKEIDKKYENGEIDKIIYDRMSWKKYKKY